MKIFSSRQFLSIFCQYIYTMKKLLILAILFSLVIASCKSAPEGFCDCMEKGKELDKQTKIILQGEASLEAKKKMVEIRKEKKKVCAPFENSNGNEMREWRKACD